MITAKYDWHPADIIAALKKKGTTLSAVSRNAGLASATLGNALARHWPKGEKLISEALGLPPEKIWPSRYSVAKRNNSNGSVMRNNSIKS